MIVADTSALAAIVFGEPGYELYAAALDTNTVLLSTASLTESRLVFEGRHGSVGADELNHVVATAVDRLVPYDEDHALAAHLAWRRFGKGHHPAALNFGDCMAYATAKVAGLPLLFKGDDFTQTDVASAI